MPHEPEAEASKNQRYRYRLTVACIAIIVFLIAALKAYGNQLAESEVRGGFDMY
jgi:hypothetical protein